MNYVSTGVLAASLLAAAPQSTALVAGSVRDQHGAPVDGATVAVYAGTREVGTVRTAADGTFIFDGAGTRVRIRCAYCRATDATVSPDGIATAIVERYDAVRSEGPTPDDVANLPSDDVPTLLQRIPFVVVNQTSGTIPGASATDRNATPYGGLFVLDSVPDYDVTANVTPFDTVPQGGAASVSVLRVDRAYLYGNDAQGGTFVVQTPGGTTRAGTGDDSLLRGALNASNLSATAAFSNAQVGDRAQRVSLADAFTTPGTAGSVILSSGSGYVSPDGSNALFSSFSSADAEVHSRGPLDAFVTAIVDHGTYAYTAPNYPISSAWSDTDVEAGVDSHAVIAPFVHVDVRESSGWYLSNPTGPGTISGWLGQARTSGGVTFHSTALDVLLAGGVNRVGYADVIGANMRYSQNANDGVFSFTFRPAADWSLHASTNSGYTLQNYVGVYAPFDAGFGYGTPVLAGHTNEAMIEFGDRSRTRAAVTALEWGGADGSATSSAGASVAWQIAPNLSLRTWLLRAQSTIWSPATIGSAWVTYANGNDFRIDVMWGRSLLDHVPYDHLDGSISGRINDHVDWFASSARLYSAQQTAVGLRIR
ncbi:MAG: TonB-dependent receptor plug domain-containing protein [Candidatus Eremiobacteraeota bacterium]|nr:TonB-dependent receptor plug domain-containing protein [Candidatus Eremiobacteraeota bacterium]